MAETTFENAKVGDKVWSPMYGWGVIDDTLSSVPDGELIRVIFKEGGHTSCACWYERSGRLSDRAPQSLFWSKVNITAPERPKRKVQKTVEAWANIYENRDPCFHYTEKDANCLQSFVDKRLFCVKLTGTYEVEE